MTGYTEEELAYIADLDALVEKRLEEGVRRPHRRNLETMKEENYDPETGKYLSVWVIVLDQDYREAEPGSIITGSVRRREGREMSAAHIASLTSPQKKRNRPYVRKPRTKDEKYYNPETGKHLSVWKVLLGEVYEGEDGTPTIDGEVSRREWAPLLSLSPTTQGR